MSEEFNPFNPEHFNEAVITYPRFIEAVNGHYVYEHKKKGFFVRCPSNPFLYDSGYFKGFFEAVRYATGLTPPAGTLTFKKKGVYG